MFLYYTPQPPLALIIFTLSSANIFRFVPLFFFQPPLIPPPFPLFSPPAKKADCTIAMSDTDLLALMTGKMNPQTVSFSPYTHNVLLINYNNRQCYCLSFHEQLYFMYVYGKKMADA